MTILTLNAGSSSLKYALFERRGSDLIELVRGHVDGIGLDRCLHRFTYEKEKLEESFKADDHIHAVLKAFHTLQEKAGISLKSIKVVGHRVVHGGEKFSQPTKITPAILAKIKSLALLAPLHNPPALAGILATKRLLPKATQVAVFDTGFHQTIPREAFLYGLPIELYEKYGIRKYGFHGISHEYLSRLAIKALGPHKRTTRVITCHLGNGSSITAVRDGKSIDTSMGFTPLDGLMMGTRSGKLDPEIIFFLLKSKHYSVDQLEEMLQKRSGLKGISGQSDVRELHARAMQGDEHAILALDMLAYRIAKYIGSYTAALGGVDAIVFAGGIGENAYYLRRKACAYLRHLGVSLDAQANRQNLTFIQEKKSAVKVLVLKTDEERAIAEQTNGF